MEYYKVRERSPYSFANVNLLGKCNLDCVFCLGKDLEVEFGKYNNLKDHFLEWDNFEYFLRVCEKHGIRNIYITGQNTDSLLYEYLADLIVYLQDERGFNVGIRTNGLLAERYVDVLSLCKASVSYTLLTFDPVKMKLMTGNEKIPPLKDVIPRVKARQRVATVVTEYNQEEIEELVLWASQFPQIKYFQIRRISTDFRQDEMLVHQSAFDRVKERLERKYPSDGDYETAPSLVINGLPTFLWSTVSTTANSLNYFTNGVCSDEYFIIEGYLRSKFFNFFEEE